MAKTKSDVSKEGTELYEEWLTSYSWEQRNEIIKRYFEY